MTRYSYEDLLALMGVGEAHPGGMAMTKEILSSILINGDTEVLEVGCGTGKTTSYLARSRGCKMTALEKNPVMLQRASERFARDRVDVKLVQGCAEGLPFEDASFDLVIVESVTVFTNISHALKEYKRVLRPGGFIIDMEMTAEVPLQPRLLQEFNSVYGVEKVPVQQEWFNLFESAGFSKVSVIKGGTVASLPANQPTADGMAEIYPSPLLHSQLFNIYTRHLYLQTYYANVIGYRVYLAQ